MENQGQTSDNERINDIQKNKEISIIHRENIFAKAVFPCTDVKPNTNSRVGEGM